MIAGRLHLGIRPAAKHHGSDLAAVDHALAAFPVCSGIVVFGQTFCNSVIENFVNIVGTGTIAGIGERIGSMGQLLVHISGIAGSGAADVSVPGTHCPACGIVCIKGNSICLLFDQLQIFDELFAGLGKLGDTGCFKDLLVVKNALRVSRTGNAVDNAAVLGVGCKTYQ